MASSRGTRMRRRVTGNRIRSAKNDTRASGVAALTDAWLAAVSSIAVRPASGCAPLSNSATRHTSQPVAFTMTALCESDRDMPAL